MKNIFVFRVAFISSLLLLLLPFHIHAQSAIDSVHYSPYSVIYNHLYHLQPESYNAQQAAKSFPKNQNPEQIEKNIKLARQLKQILNGKGLYVDIHMVPDKTILKDSSSRQVYTLFKSDPKIYLERTKKGWYYSRTTVENIPKLHREVFPLGTNMMKQLVNPKWEEKFLTIKAWQWLGMAIMLLAALIVHRILTLVFRFAIPRLARRKFVDRESEVLAVKKSARTFSLFVVTRLLILFLPTLLLNPKAAFYIMRALHIFNAVFFIFFLFNLADLFMVYLTKVAERTKNTMDDQLVPVTRRIIKGAILIAGIIYILNLLDVNVTALLAGISIGGLALALAAQDTVKNMIGSVMIFIDKPFQIGDWISFGEVDGTVEEVGMRSTRVRTFANSVTYVPNGKLADMTVNNMGVRFYRRFKTDLAITYDTPPHIIDAFVEGIREMVRTHPNSRKDNFEVHLNGFGENSLNILIYMFFQVPNWTDELVGRHDMIIGIIKLADRLGVRFAFPTSTLHIEDFPEKQSRTPKFNSDEEEVKLKVKQFMEEFKSEVNAPNVIDFKHAAEERGKSME